MYNLLNFKSSLCLDPVTGLMAVGTAVSVAGAVSGAAAGAQSGRYNARVATANAAAQKNIDDYNSQVGEINADTAEQQANWQAGQTRKAGARVRGAQESYFGKYGLVGGSSNDIMRESAFNNEMQALTEQYKGSVAANSYRNQARMDTYRGQYAERVGKEQANLYNMSASSAMSRGFFSAAGSLLQGGARAYSYGSSLSGSGATIPQWDSAYSDYPELIA